MRLSYYGGGHYDSIVDRDHSVHLCLKKPGELEDQRISWCRRRAMDGFNRRFTDVEASEAMIVELACKESRRIEAEREHDDLETTLMLSLQDSNDKRIGNDKALMDCKEVDALVTQGELLRSVQEESEREYLEKALVSSLPDGDATSSLKETTEPIDESMKLALELSNLTDEQVLELALKQSLQAVNGAEQINTMSGDMHDMYSSTVDEDEMLRRAIAASLESSRAPPDEDIDVYPEEDVDEDLLLAIQESLRK